MFKFFLSQTYNNAPTAVSGVTCNVLKLTLGAVLHFLTYHGVVFEEEEKKRKKWRSSDELETSLGVSLKLIHFIMSKAMDRRRVDRKKNVDKVSPGRYTLTKSKREFI